MTWEEARSRLGYRSKAMMASSADKWDQQTGADICAALERVEELERAQKGCEEHALAADARADTAEKRVGEMERDTGMGHALPDQQCSAIEHKALREENARLLREQDAMVEEAADEQTRSIKAALMDALHDHALTTRERDEARAEAKAHDVLATRCLAHAQVPPLNPNGPNFQECGACIHEVKEQYRAELARVEGIIAAATDFRLDALRAEARRIRGEKP